MQLRNWKSVSLRRAMLPMLVLNHLPESSFKSSTLSLTKSLYSQPHRPASPSTGQQPGWQQPWWSGMHCTPSWLRGHGRNCVSHNAPVEYRRPCSCYFPPEWGLLRMTHCYINKGRNQSRLFVRERVELFITELSGRWLRTNIGSYLIFKCIKIVRALCTSIFLASHLQPSPHTCLRPWSVFSLSWFSQ